MTTTYVISFINYRPEDHLRFLGFEVWYGDTPKSSVFPHLPGEGLENLTKVRLLLLLLRLLFLFISASSGCSGLRLDRNSCQREIPEKAR